MNTTNTSDQLIIREDIIVGTYKGEICLLKQNKNMQSFTYGPAKYDLASTLYYGDPKLTIQDIIDQRREEIETCLNYMINNKPVPDEEYEYFNEKYYHLRGLSFY